MRMRTTEPEVNREILPIWEVLLFLSGDYVMREEPSSLYGSFGRGYRIEREAGFLYGKKSHKCWEKQRICAEIGARDEAGTTRTCR